MLVTTLGTPYQPCFQGKILFLEDVDEKPYAFDRMLTHLWNAGILAQVAGVAVGVNKQCDNPKSGSKEYQQSADDVNVELMNLDMIRARVVRKSAGWHEQQNQPEQHEHAARRGAPVMAEIVGSAALAVRAAA